jgi:tetratricopeptide (TPR) repeat protein
VNPSARRARERTSPKRARTPRPKARAARPAARFADARALDVALALVCGALALWAQRRTLDAYFSIDDLVHFERLRGLVPGTSSIWRWISNEAYMRGALGWFGANARPYHVVNWLLHGANAALLYAFVRALGGGAPGAVLAAGLFSTSRLYLPALFQAVGMGELLALTGTLGAMLLALRDGVRARVLALASFVVALLAKESVAFLPAVLLISTGRDESLRSRLARAGPLLVLGLGYFAFLYVMNSKLGGARGEAYAMGFGTNLFHNLMTYCAWVADLRSPMPDARNGIDELAWKVGLWVALGLLLIALATIRRTRLPLVGAAWFVLALGPILPLLHHSFAYYLYAPLAGLGLLLGGALDATVRNRVAAWALVMLAIVAHAWRSDQLTEIRLLLRVRGSDLALDSFLRKSEVAHHAAAGVERAITGREHVKIFVYRPPIRQHMYSATTGQEISMDQAAAAPIRKYDLVTEVLDQGRALRAIYPAIDTLVFADRWEPALKDYELFLIGEGYGLYSMGTGAEAVNKVAGLLVTNEYPEIARQLYADAIVAMPDDASLRVRYAELLEQSGDRAAATAQLEEALRRSPSDPAAMQARAMLLRMRAKSR